MGGRDSLSFRFLSRFIVHIAVAEGMIPKFVQPITSGRSLLALEARQGVLDRDLLLQAGRLLAGRHLEHAVEVQVELHDDLVAGRRPARALRSGTGRRGGCGARRRLSPW